MKVRHLPSKKLLFIYDNFRAKQLNNSSNTIDEYFYISYKNMTLSDIS